MKIGEIWKPIPGRGAHYEASNLGNIRVKERSVIKKTRWGGLMTQHYPGRLLRPSASDKYGHLIVHIGWDGNKENAFVHHLVLLAFKGHPGHGQQARHDDGVPGHNSIENLFWGTHLENMADRKRHGKYAIGEAHVMTKFTSEQAHRIKSGQLSCRQAMQQIGISRTHFYRIRRGQNWAEALRAMDGGTS